LHLSDSQLKPIIMKLSKSLLQAIVLGASLGTTAASCDLIDTGIAPKTAKPSDEETNTRQPENKGGTCELPTNNIPDNCAACGMG
jgi:hypothetical protein